MSVTARIRRRSAALLALVALLGLWVSTAPAQAAPARSGAERIVESRLFTQHNVARTSPQTFGEEGDAAAAFRWAEDVAEVARDWADHMAAEDDFRFNPGVATEVCCHTAVADSVGAVLGPDYFTFEAAADKLVAMLMDSPVHRERLMTAAFTQIGVGVHVDANDKVWVAVVYRDPDGAPEGSETYPHPLPDPPPAPGDEEGDTDPPVEPPEEEPVEEPVEEAPVEQEPDDEEPLIYDVGPACPDTVPRARFRDVTRPAAERAVSCLVWWDVASGTSPTTFDPNTHVRRDQMASFVARAIEASGGSLPRASQEYTDVPDGVAHAEAVNELSAAGILGGSNGRFRPGETISRGQMTQTLVRAYEYRTGQSLPAPDRQWFSDVAGTTFARTINQSADAGWSAGIGDGTFHPDDGVRRDQMAMFLTRWLATLVDEGAAALPR